MLFAANKLLTRAIKYTAKHNPDWSIDEIAKEACEHQITKYGKNGSGNRIILNVKTARDNQERMNNIFSRDNWNELYKEALQILQNLY